MLPFLSDTDSFDPFTGPGLFIDVEETAAKHGRAVREIEPRGHVGTELFDDDLRLDAGSPPVAEDEAPSGGMGVYLHKIICMHGTYCHLATR